MTASTTAPRKRSHSDMKDSRAPCKLIDDDTYRTLVLRLSPQQTEEQLDDQLVLEAHELGVMSPQTPTTIDGITCSLSATTIASETNNQSSILSGSTAPTSCSSSERRPITQSSQLSTHSPTQSNTPSMISDIEKKRGVGFRKGFRRMTGFRKKRSLMLDSPTAISINSQVGHTTTTDQLSGRSGLKSPASIKSSKSSWSSPPSAMKSSYEHPSAEEQAALKRSMDCKELSGLRMSQLEERDRFIQYRRQAFGQLRSQHVTSRQGMVKEQRRVIAEMTEKNEKAIEDLESRQLEDEMKLVKDFEMEKRTALVRLRHMEAYCRNPTPPPTPLESSNGLKSEGKPLPPRKVTDKDYHNLAQQYRERDTMDVLHASKINVLRGKQKKAVENFVQKKDREIEALEKQYSNNLEILEREAKRDEDGLRVAFGTKRTQIETRWKLQALVERAKLEKITGLRYAALPELLAVEEAGTNGL